MFCSQSKVVCSVQSTGYFIACLLDLKSCVFSFVAKDGQEQLYQQVLEDRYSRVTRALANSFPLSFPLSPSFPLFIPPHSFLSPLSSHSLNRLNHYDCLVTPRKAIESHVFPWHQISLLIEYEPLTAPLFLPDSLTSAKLKEYYILKTARQVVPSEILAPKQAEGISVLVDNSSG